MSENDPYPTESYETYVYGTDTDTEVDAPATATGWRHPLNVGHLVMGIAFLGLVLVWALVSADAVVGDDIRWLMPIPWVAAGGAGLVAMALAARRRS
jgi:hypothetical protein